ncbi:MULTISPECIES: dephospho-CoA kinase [Glutamicibacter]|uniref:Dephospho-CoA kinase n=2 Tax=Glutamicibacter arilaitensis TaxID=256701 RepID=A0A2N7S3G3_9MICC|nr:MULTISPECIES: dephospho-CoA kinase [Glutamicibacter]PMQ20689.1 dephospho-CoA kinase [Glutamicibacter arilaitensis]CBT76146.1 dephospho-CoA kinase [Glutamicibacter arilaitensis Re117]HCH47461.1 dephospho-CoA kinase [Glutamicibacter sp.]HCJ54254.1 dephospho-CoA kinase [Glutamicibacter sp.]HCM94920.1 dephospho-CoA kinase [Glutamicibacter sp.]
MLHVGLTGAVASGKSAVAAKLAALGAVVIDADKLARQVVEPGTPGLGAIKDTFGEDVLLPDGSLNRPALAAIVFSDEAQRAKLNAIVHPLVRAQAQKLRDAAPKQALVVEDIPLLVESGQAEKFDAVVVVQAPLEERMRRMVYDRGWTEADAKARIAAQATDEQRAAVADYLLDNSGSLAELEAQVESLYQQLAPTQE